MSVLDKGLAAVGVAKQAAFGTPTAQPTFLHGVLGGNVVKVEIDQPAEDRTLAAARIAPEVNRLKVVHGVQFTCRAHPGSSGLYLYGALGAIATAGAGPYTHTITPASDLPYFTFWGLYNGGIYRVQDCRIDELTLKWDEAGPYELEIVALGAVPGYPASVTPGTDEQQATKFQAGGGTFKEDILTSTPVTAPVKAGQVKISNSAEPVILSKSVVPQDVAVGRQSFETGLTLVPANLDEWREIVTGSAAGTTISEQPLYGSYETKAILDANTDLMLAAPRVAYACEFPEADPSGGAVELELAGMPVLPASGAAFTATLRNSVASY